LQLTQFKQSDLNKKMKTKHMKTLDLIKSLGRSPLRLGFLLIPLALAWLALSPAARAVTPAPDGGYPGENTAEGDFALFSLTGNGVRNTAVGFNALFSNTGGGANTAIGDSALTSNTTSDNTACGSYALNANTTGSSNTAFGTDALMLNINGNSNNATGVDALFNNTSGSANTANGDRALFSNTTGDSNTAIGFDALYSNTTGTNNTATGFSALLNNTRADGNTANGYQALISNTTGSRNTANGAQALYHNNGSFNTANGWRALTSNTTGNNNVANGWQALLSNTTGYQNTANGNGALDGNTTGGANTALGINAGNNLTTGNGNVCIGANVGGVAGESNTTRIKNVYASVASGRAVYVNSDNKLGTLLSTRRVKENIKPMDKASEAILALKPVSFRYKKEIDASGSPQFGLIAEDVAGINPDLVTRDAEGNPETVRYDSINAMLLNEFLKEHHTVQEQDARLTKQEAFIARQQKQIEALTAGLQKVSAQVEMSRRAPQMVDND
jgi:hypothetical protein